MRLNLPKSLRCPWVYHLISEWYVVYVWSSQCLWSRIGNHILEKNKVFDDVEIYPCDNYLEVEARDIKIYNPKYNKRDPIDARYISKSKRILVCNIIRKIKGSKSKLPYQANIEPQEFYNILKDRFWDFELLPSIIYSSTKYLQSKKFYFSK